MSRPARGHVAALKLAPPRRQTAFRMIDASMPLTRRRRWPLFMGRAHSASVTTFLAGHIRLHRL